MKVYYLSATGNAYVEHVNPKYRLVEFKDGYHPLSSSVIFRSGDRDDEAVVFVWQGRSSPEGMDPSLVRFVLKETNRLRDNQQPVGVSKIWVRRVILGLKYVAIAIAIAVAFYAVYVYYQSIITLGD